MNGSERFQDRHEHAYGHGDERAQLDRQAQLHGGESRTFTYFCGVCWSKIRESNNAKI